MNIPKISNEINQEIRSDKIIQAKEVGNIKQDAKVSSDAINGSNRLLAGQESKGFSMEKLDSLVTETEKHLEANNVKLKFNLVEESNTVQVEIVDSFGKTIRKIPGDDLIKLSESLKNLGQGFLDKIS